MADFIEKDANGNEVWSVSTRSAEKGVVIAISDPFLNQLQAERLADAILRANGFGG